MVQKLGEDFRWLRHQLQCRGINNLVLVLIASRLTAYAPWLEVWNGREAPARYYLDGFERELVRPVVNGLTVIRQRVASDVAKGKLCTTAMITTGIRRASSDWLKPWLRG